ncbi:head GIN domain-containing protein [Dyadobacter sp. LHD-138]|uniref:head GIN domain-containing protein n=1 Tax=Dyadobacter sp. LHD-138 TaxID=3071413 RepID=UPI0027E1B9ED|nr:head GIN domain-containing protein [Dyadobacter sp. LHD-138]MDQ6481259.1 head GIN domain-containing protein [Dyadobacter sp. LHD-138]
MKKLFLFGIACLLSTAMAFAQESRTFNLSGFNKLAMGSSFKIEVKQGKQFSVTASGQSADVKELEAKVVSGVLKIGYRGNNWNKNRKTVDINITMPTLEAVDFSGASKAQVGNFPDSKTMAIEVSGASSVNMNFSAPKVSFELSGASSLTIVGQTDILNGEVSGASSFKGENFPAKEVNIDASGASSANVVASASIHADASGASRIRYGGSVKDIHSNTSGASSVKRD